jgi:hypothetical protein
MTLWDVWRKPCTYLAPTPTLSPDVPKQDSTWPTSPRRSIGCVKNDFRACGSFGANCAPILRQDSHYLQTNWIELPLEPRHLGVPSGVSKMISKPIRCLAQTVHLSRQIKTRFHRTHVRYEFHWVRQKRFLSLRFIQHKSCTYLTRRLPLSPKGLNWGSTWASSPRTTIDCVQNDFWANGMFGANRAPILYRHKHYLQPDRNKIPPDPRHIIVPSGVSNTIFEPLVRSIQTVHLCCVKITTLSKRTKPSFHLSIVT